MRMQVGEELVHEKSCGTRAQQGWADPSGGLIPGSGDPGEKREYPQDEEKRCCVYWQQGPAVFAASEQLET